MKSTRAAQRCKYALSGIKHRLIQRARRLVAVLISASLVLGGFPSAFFQAFAASDDSTDYNFTIEGQDFYDALIEAVSNGTTVDKELEFSGEYAEDYDELFDPDGTLYELEDFAKNYIKEKDKDAERDKNMALRVFLRIEGDIPFDVAYEPDGTEEVIFLLMNRTDEELSATITVDDRMTEAIVVPDHDSIPEGDTEDVKLSDVAARSLSGGAGAASADVKIVIDISNDEDGEDGSINEESDVETEDGKKTSGNGRGRNNFVRDEEKPAENKPDEGKVSDSKDAPKGKEDFIDKDTSKDRYDNRDREDSKGEGVSKSKENSRDKDNSGSKKASKNEKNSEDKVASLSRSENKSLLLSAAVASASNAGRNNTASPSTVSPSDAELINGTVYEPVRFGRRGAVAFVTTTADMGFEADMIRDYRLIYEGEDYRVTLEYDHEAHLPQDVILTAAEYDKDSDIFIERYEEAKEFYGWDDGKEPSVRLFDVTLYSDDEEVEPASPVDVTFTFFDDGNDGEVSFLSSPAEEDENGDEAESGYKSHRYMVTHFGEDETETVESEVIAENGDQCVSFRLESFSDIMVMIWSEDSKGKVVLNLGNGNGRYNNADYTHDRHEGTLLRYTTDDSLADYADNDRKVTINLPSNDQLGSTFTLVDTYGSLSAVTFDLDSPLAYDYKLVGWVNIATGEYYDVSDGMVEAEIDLNNDNVFYADWIAATYDHGSQSDDNLRDDIVSTSGFVTINMYDYNELFNLYSESLEQNEDDDGILWEAWTDSGNLYNALPYPSGNRLTSSFIFVNNGTEEYSSPQGEQDTGGMLSWPNYKTNGNTWTGSGQMPRNATQIWGITAPDSTPLDLLFDKNSAAIGVNYVGEADYLFWVDEDGYYTYNSKEAAAAYNQTDQRFYVYKGVQNVDYTDFSCFLPYNTYGDELSALNGTVNYFFGMDMEVNFYLPNATGTEGGNKMNGKDMVFNYSGDDDILIFVDDELVLDMSGIHDESFGSINFSDGSVKMAMSEEGLDTAEGTFLNLTSGSHDLKVRYLERGGYASNLEIQFNLISLWDYETGDVQTITADKVWMDAQGKEIDPNDLTDEYKENGVEIGLFDVMGPAVEATNDSEGTFGYTRDGDVYTVEFTDDSDVTRTYVYDASKPTLTYTEVSGDGTITGVDDETNSSGRVIDKDGLVVAWLETDENGIEKLHIRMDKQTLNNANDWHYAWELLDPDGDYEVLELSESSSYSTASERENLQSYEYWSIIGDAQIENSFETGETLVVILTEAAQEHEETLGDTKDALGYVIVADESGVSTKEVEFSQIAELSESDEESDQTSQKTITGVTSKSEINALGSGAIWYVVDAKATTTDVSGTVLEDFKLYCDIDGTKYYLVLLGSAGDYSLGVTSTERNAGTFCYDSLGEALAVLEDGSTVRLEIDPDGDIVIADDELQAAKDDIRFFTLQETATTGFAFTATNTFNPDSTKSVDADGDGSFDDDGESVKVGDMLTYKITYANTDDDPETVIIMDELDRGLTYVEGSASDLNSFVYDEDNNKLTWTIENVPAHSSGSVTFKAIVNSTARSEGEVPNTATVQVDDHPAQNTNTVKNPVSSGGSTTSHRSGGSGGSGSGSSGGGSGSGGPGSSGGSGEGDFWDLLPMPSTGQGWAMLIGGCALIISAIALIVLLWVKRKESKS